MAFLAWIRLACPGSAEDQGMKKIAIVWPGFTGYMGDCWRALAARHEVKVWIEPSGFEHGFDGSELAGLDWRRVEPGGESAAVDEMRRFAPDAILACGWSTPLALAVGAAKMNCSKVIAFDMPWERTFRKFAARWALWPRLRHFDAAFVPGSRTAKYARWLGFRIVVEGSNPSGWERFSRVERAERVEGFLYTGRLSEEKGLDILAAAYVKYRELVENPWPLDIVGCGKISFPDIQGVTQFGFVPPEKMPAIVSRHVALLLTSRRENWGISAMEAMSAGLVTIASDACGFTHDVEPTIKFRSGDVSALCEAMMQVHSMGEGERRAARERGMAQAEKYSAAKWAERFETLLERVGE